MRFASQLRAGGKIGWLYPAVNEEFISPVPIRIKRAFQFHHDRPPILVAYRLARRLEIPWVADFALPWSDAYWLTGRPRMIEQLDRKLERLVVRSARHITVAYPSSRVAFQSVTAAPWKRRSQSFQRDFRKSFLPEARLAAKFTVVYPGNHFCESGRHGDYFLRAIDDWIASDASLERKIEFVFIGKRDDDLLRQRAAMAHPKSSGSSRLFLTAPAFRRSGRRTHVL